MSTSSETLMQSCFPSLEVTVVNDIFSQCNSDPQTAIEQLCLLFPEAYVIETQGQAQHQMTVPEPWTPPSQIPAQSPKRLTRGKNTPSRASGSLNTDFMQMMFPTSPQRSKKDPPEGSTRLNGQSRDMLSQLNKIDCVKTDMNDDRTLVDGYSDTSDKGMQQVAHPAHASLPFLQHLLPLEKSLAKASPNGGPTGLSPATPSGTYDVQASSSDWDTIMKNSLPISKTIAVTSTLAGPNKRQGLEQAVDAMSGLPETILQLVKSRSSFTESSSPDRGPSGLVRPPEKPGAEGPMEQGGGLALLQEMFCTMDAALVRDVLHNVRGDSDKACHQLLLIQNVTGQGDTVDLSCPSSDDGSGSASQYGVGSKGDASSANGGCIWDWSGVPVDYTFKDLTGEQKVAMIRKELPLCTAEEAHNALEACSMDVNAALASLSQVYDRNGRHAAASSHTDLPHEVIELQKIFPSADPEALINALSVSDNNIETAKATLRDNGMNPIALPGRIEPRARSPTKKAPSGLFSPPQPAEVKQLPLGAPLAPGNDYDCAPNKAVLWRRSHVDNQKLYDDHRSLAESFREEMSNAFIEMNKAYVRGDMQSHQKLRTDFHQARINFKAAQYQAGKAIYRQKNKDLNDIPLKVDLHGLHVHEAVGKLVQVIEDWRRLPETMQMSFKRLDVITGKGIHSKDNVAKILAAVIDRCEQEGMEYYQKPRRDGVMIHLPEDPGQPSGDSSADWFSSDGYS